MSQEGQKNTLVSRRFRGRRQRPSQPKAAVSHHELFGGSLKVPQNPPSVAYQPWNHLTVVHAGSTSTTGEITITVPDLVAQLRSQTDPIGTGLSKSTIINLKLQRVRAWNLTGNMIALSVDDFSDTAKSIADVDALCGLVDTGSKNHTPAVGYDIPSTHRNLVLRNDKLTSTSVLYHVMAPSSDTVVIYTTVLWKFDGPSKFSTFNSTMLDIVRTINENVQGMAAGVSALRETVEDLDARAKKHQGLAIGNTIVDGALKAVPYVISVAAKEDDKMERVIKALENMKVVPDVPLNVWLDTVTTTSFDRISDIDDEIEG
uniref:Uncharacterized protein n=1 Tax=Nefer virus TaxID=2800931 RepID=A0A894KIX6_9VIRU|nr:MAG: hypothetical protein [Nefer virus]